MASALTLSLVNQEAPYCFRIPIPTFSTKKDKEKNLERIMMAIVALSNSGGGKLVLSFDSPDEEHVDKLHRAIEQRVQALTSTSTLSSKFHSRKYHEELVFTVPTTTNPTTLNYNYFLPTETQVVAVRSSEPIEEVQRLLRGNRPQDNCISIGSHQREFKQGRNCGLQESKTVQLKCLETKNMSPAGFRNNKIKNYVSSFSNHRGGYIYCGIEDNGAVKGQTISEEEKEKIVQVFSKIMEKMVYNGSHKPQKGQHWEIFFEPVVNEEGLSISSTYVVVIYIAQYNGDVFADEPESYEIVEGVVKKISFDRWKELLFSPESSVVPSHLARGAWRSMWNRKVHHYLTTELVEKRNDGDIQAFTRMGDFMRQKDPRSLVRLLLLSEKVALCIKRGELKEAHSLLSRFDEFDNEDEVQILEVIKLYLESRLERAQGDYKKSYDIAEVALSKAELIAPELVTVRLCLHASNLATMLSSAAADGSTSDVSANRKQLHLDAAFRYSKALPAFRKRVQVDLQQKCRIYRAAAHLGVSMDGEVSLDRVSTTPEGIKYAAVELQAVSQANVEGHVPTRVRKIQFLLMQSDLSCAYSKNAQDAKGPKLHLNNAIENAENAVNLAGKYGFKELIGCAEKRLKTLDEMLRAPRDADSGSTDWETEANYKAFFFEK